MLLVPAFALAALVLAALAVGAPPRAEAIVPLLVPPPSDSFQDIGIISLGGHAGGAAWMMRIGFAIARTALYALVAVLAVQRARGEAASVPLARRAIVSHARTFGALGALSFGYALAVSQQALLDPSRDATLAASAMAVGTLFFPGAFVAAAVRGTGAVRSLWHGIVFPKPAGHIVLVLGYSAAVNGLFRLASFGEAGRPRALPLTLYALIAALLTAVFTAALARRYVLLRSP